MDDVVRRARQGDVDAFESIYRAHAPAVYGLCRRMTGDETRARELTQDAFVRAWERLAQFQGRSSLRTWLHRLTVNVILHSMRADKRHADRLTGFDEGFAALSRESGIEEQMDVDAAVAKLPANARMVFVLHDVEGYSHEEIAGMMHIASGTARAHLWRARRALIKVLDP